MPAVSTNHHGSPSISSSSSTGSRVVPAMSCTTTRCSPANALRKEDLPTLGLPTRAIRNTPSLGFADATADSLGRTSMRASSRSPDPRPCRAEIGCGSPIPSAHRPAASDSSCSESTLFAASTTGLPELRSNRTMCSSVAVIPTAASRTKITTSDWSIAICAWCATVRSSPLTSTSQPPVSTRVNRWPAHSAA